MWPPIVCLFFLAFAMTWPRLSAGPLAGTEAHRALPAHTMVQTGQWVIPYLGGRPYLRKPPLQPWCIAISEILTRHATEWAWRLPSAIEYALLVALMTATGGAWFGRAGAWTSGVALLAIVPLWSQAGSADVDTLNTLTATATAVVLLQLVGAQRQRALWRIGGGIALGACLLTKGPAGLPIVVGAAITRIVLRRSTSDTPASQHHIRTALIDVAVILLIGLACFGVYAAIAIYWLKSHDIPLNSTTLAGLREGAENLKPASVKTWLQAFLLPPMLVLYALPVSGASLAMLSRRVRNWLDDAAHRRVMAVLLSIAIAWAVQLCVGLHNPRYAFPTLPLLALPAGALATLAYHEIAADRLRRSLAVACIAWTIAVIVLAVTTFHHAATRAPIAACVLAVIACGFAVRKLWLQQTWRGGAWMAVLLVPLLAVPFTEFTRADRFRKSGYATSPILRRTMGAGNTCVVGAMLRFEPELFWYAGVIPHAYREEIPKPQELTEPTWLVLKSDEFTKLYAKRKANLKRVIPFKSYTESGDIVYYNPHP